MTFALLLAAGLLLQAAPAVPDSLVYEGRPVAAWISDLGSKKYDVEAKAKKAIAAIGRPAVPGLLEALSSPRAEMRAGATWALGSIGDPAAVPAVIALLSDKERSVGNAAAHALGELRDERAVEPLLAGLQIPGPDKEFHGYARLYALADIGTEKALAGLAGIATTDVRPSARADAVKALGRMKDARTVEPLGSALKDPDEQVRTAAADGLRSLDTPRVIELLEAAAADTLTGKPAAMALRDVDTRGKPAVTVGDFQVTFMGLETAETWGSRPSQFNAKKGYELVIVRYRLKFLAGTEKTIGAIEAVELYDTEGFRLQTAAASAGRFSLSMFGKRKAGEAVTSDSAFAAKKGTKLGKCKVQGAEFDLAGVVPVPRKER
jgi:HEAT repeats